MLVDVLSSLGGFRRATIVVAVLLPGPGRGRGTDEWGGACTSRSTAATRPWLGTSQTVWLAAAGLLLLRPARSRGQHVGDDALDGTGPERAARDVDAVRASGVRSWALPALLTALAASYLVGWEQLGCW